jgi:LuxR family maltose regulon positive regulatory protein
LRAGLYHLLIVTPDAPTAASDLLLKVTPPRVPRHLVARAALAASRPPFRDASVILVQAPAGFGKTSLLAQWRREHLAHGEAVAWVSAQPQDDAHRFVQALAMAVRVGAGRPAFGHVLLNPSSPAGLEGITTWLAEVAHAALDIVLLVDDADRLPDESREALAYLLRNAPPNLRCIVAARADCQLGVDDLIGYGHGVAVGTNQLRLSLEDTINLMRGRFGPHASRDDAARLHEMAEGWPLGLQVALAVAESAGNHALLPRLDLHDGALREQFVGFLLRNLDSADLDFLTRVSVADHLHPHLCELLAPDADALTRLARLVRDTPLFTAGEQTEWLRMHSLARGALRKRFDALDAQVQARVHAAAADWLADRGLIDAAARHALAAGQYEKAYSLAERSLYNSLMTQGRQAAVLDWLDHMSAQELDRRPRLLLAAAWSLASGERHDEARRLVSRILAQPVVDDALRWECALILGSAANFADDPDGFAQLHDPWAHAPPPTTDPMLLQVHANRVGFRALLAGEPALARLRQHQVPRSPSGYLDRWGDLIVALSYLWEGQVVPAENLLRPALAAAEGDLGRRSALASMLAALLAAALWERDRPEEASALLANRLDVIERSALPECTLLAFRTLARIAVAGGAEQRAVELLKALDAVGQARGLPRLRVASLSEQVRMHARRYRGQSCRELSARLDALLAEPGIPRGPMWQRSVRTHQALAHGFALIAAQDWRAALEPLAQVEAMVRQSQLGSLRIELLGLRALVLDRCGERASQLLLREALDLATSFGLQRVFADAHPDLGNWARETAQCAQAGRPADAPAAPARPSLASAAALRATASMAFTPKEREVLELLARSLSNKEIALALQVGEETIKWHVKNLFAKMDAGTRKQVVSRARMLGLLAEAA